MMGGEFKHPSACMKTISLSPYLMASAPRVSAQPWLQLVQSPAQLADHRNRGGERVPLGTASIWPSACCSSHGCPKPHTILECICPLPLGVVPLLCHPQLSVVAPGTLPEKLLIPACMVLSTSLSLSHPRPLGPSEQCWCGPAQWSQ